MAFCTIIGKTYFSYNKSICTGRRKMKKTKMLKKNYEFRNVLSKGKYYSGKNIEAFILKSNKKYNLLGLAISTKVAKAVKRNMIKRLLRENYKELESKITEGYSIVFLWKRKVDIKQANYTNIKKDMELIFGNAKIYKKEERL